MSRFFNYSLAPWCLEAGAAKLDFDATCGIAKKLGLGLDLVPYEKWPALRDQKEISVTGFMPYMGSRPPEYMTAVPPFIPGFNDPEAAERTYAGIDGALNQASEAGVKNVLVFTGFDTKEIRATQFARIVAGYVRRRGSAQESLVMKAERLGITLNIEMLNTRGDEQTWKGHPGYLGDDMWELVLDVVRKVGSPNFNLAFDAYHIGMMDGNPIDRLREHSKFVGLVHVAGVMRQAEGHHPQNRGELTLPGQEIDYREFGHVMREVLPPGTNVLLEYIPTTTTRDEVVADLVAAIDLLEPAAVTE